VTKLANTAAHVTRFLTSFDSLTAPVAVAVAVVVAALLPIGGTCLGKLGDAGSWMSWRTNSRGQGRGRWSGVADERADGAAVVNAERKLMRICARMWTCTPSACR